MKKVFSSIPEVCHIWANQIQGEGKSGNVYFEGNKIYSYGSHFQMAEIVTSPKGDKVAFINSNRYSNTTAKHLSHVRHSIPDGVKAFNVPFTVGTSYYSYRRVTYFDISYLPKIIETMLIEVKNLCFDQLNARENSHYFKQAESLYSDIVEICELFNLEKPNKPENWIQAETKAQHLTDTKQEREDKKRAKLAEKERENLSKWLNGDYNGTLYNLPVHFRYTTDRKKIQTTHGATVDVLEALHVLNLYRKGKDITGAKISGFTVRNYNELYVQIGCHKIEWQIVNEFFK